MRRVSKFTGVVSLGSSIIIHAIGQCANGYSKSDDDMSFSFNLSEAQFMCEIEKYIRTTKLCLF